MLSKNELKYYSSLLRKKERDEEGKFIAEGKRIVEEGLRSNFNCEILILTDSFLEKNERFLTNYSIRGEIVGEKEFRKLVDTEHPQGIMGVFHKKEKLDSIPSVSGHIVILEDISDPGNAGTILRNCDWFGVTSVIFSSRSVEPYNPKVVRSSMGSLFHLDIIEPDDLKDIINQLKKLSYTIICADMKGQSLYELNPDPKTALILSSEAFGPSHEITSLSDLTVTIPGKGKAESLNVASASAVILSQLTRTNAD